jgi:hypothetical protein
VSGSPHIGILREKPLHAALKEWCRQPGDLVEHPVDGFVIDVVRGDLLIEIQTNGFAGMKRKIATLVAGGHPIRIVHPIAVDRTIVKIEDDGTIVGRRLSPKHGAAIDIFSQLVSFPDLVVDFDLEIVVVLTVEDEYRVHSPGRAWRRKGWIVEERRLKGVVGSLTLASGSDLLALLPANLSEPFTTSDLAASLGRRMRVAQQMAYCLRETGLIEKSGKRGNAIEYRIARNG